MNFYYENESIFCSNKNQESLPGITDIKSYFEQQKNPSKKLINHLILINNSFYYVITEASATNNNNNGREMDVTG